VTTCLEDTARTSRLTSITPGTKLYRQTLKPLRLTVGRQRLWQPEEPQLAGVRNTSGATAESDLSATKLQRHVPVSGRPTGDLRRRRRSLLDGRRAAYGSLGTRHRCERRSNKPRWQPAQQHRRLTDASNKQIKTSSLSLSLPLSLSLSLSIPLSVLPHLPVSRPSQHKFTTQAKFNVGMTSKDDRATVDWNGRSASMHAASALQRNVANGSVIVIKFAAMKCRRIRAG